MLFVRSLHKLSYMLTSQVRKYKDLPSSPWTTPEHVPVFCFAHQFRHSQRSSFFWHIVLGYAMEAFGVVLVYIDVDRSLQEGRAMGASDYNRF